MKLLLVNISKDQVLDPQGGADFMVDTVATIGEAAGLLSLYEYDCIVVNLQNASMASFLWLEAFVLQNRNEGLIFISKDVAITDKLRAFELGVDDYIVLPVEVSEITARIKSVSRRKRYQTNTKLYVGNVVIDLYHRHILVWDQVLSLTKTEYDVFLYLNANRKRAVSKEALAEYLWGQKADELDSYNVLFAHIKNLRKKLLVAKAGIEISNIYKIGYQIIEI